MKTRLAVFVLLGMALASAGVALGGDTKAERKKFEDSWVIESVEIHGKSIPPKELAEVGKLFIFYEGKFTIVGGKEGLVGRFKLDPGKKPRHIDLTYLAPLGKYGPESRGIYAFEGDRLKLCLADAKTPRPTEFKTSKETSKVVLFTLKRSKK
jgi:uncharacterized protein (TIGR03067 family)